jgi:hypothetical protein
MNPLLCEQYKTTLSNISSLHSDICDALYTPYTYNEKNIILPSIEAYVFEKRDNPQTNYDQLLKKSSQNLMNHNHVFQFIQSLYDKHVNNSLSLSTTTTTITNTTTNDLRHLVLTNESKCALLEKRKISLKWILSMKVIEMETIIINEETYTKLNQMVSNFQHRIDNNQYKNKVDHQCAIDKLAFMKWIISISEPVTTTKGDVEIDSYYCHYMEDQLKDVEYMITLNLQKQVY